MGHKARPIEERFFDKVNKDAPNGCWEWTASLYPDGYGSIYDNVIKTNDRAHRVSWVIHNGNIPQHDSYHGMCVCHSCDNRKCVNPDHLFLATNKQNQHDMYAKGREVKARGESISHSKLNELKVRIIRIYYPTLSQKSLASIFKVSKTTIHCLVNRKTWAHI